MKQVLGIAVVAALAIFATEKAMADVVKAPVVSKQPIYSNTTVANGTKTICHDVKVYGNNQPGVFNGTGQALKGDGDAIVGAIIGGLVGNQFGGGQGKDVMTGIGVIIGSNIGAGTNEKKPTRETVCEKVPQYTTQTMVVGWNVSYQFENNIYHVQMKTDPGQYVTLDTKTTHSVRN